MLLSSSLIQTIDHHLDIWWCPRSSEFFSLSSVLAAYFITISWCLVRWTPSHLWQVGLALRSYMICPTVYFNVSHLWHLQKSPSFLFVSSSSRFVRVKVREVNGNFFFNVSGSDSINSSSWWSVDTKFKEKDRSRWIIASNDASGSVWYQLNFWFFLLLCITWLQLYINFCCNEFNISRCS